jgi:hypothetical protein
MGATGILRGVSGVALFVTGVLAQPAFAQDAKLYWAETDLVRRSNLDGSMVETIAASTGINNDVELDVAAGKVYWANPPTGEIRRRNLDGTGAIEAFHASAGAGLVGIGIDPVAGHVYFTTPGQANRMSA